MITLLAALAIAQAPSRDQRFSELVESWVIDRAVEAHQPITAGLSSEDARLVRVLGSPQYEARELAESILAGRGWHAWRTLKWGSRHNDAEVRGRCLRLLSLIRCPECLGDGRKVTADDWHAETRGYFDKRCPCYWCECNLCGGVGMFLGPDGPIEMKGTR